MLQLRAMDAPPMSSNTSECQFVSDFERNLKEAEMSRLDESVTSIPGNSTQTNHLVSHKVWCGFSSDLTAPFFIIN